MSRALPCCSGWFCLPSASRVVVSRVKLLVLPPRHSVCLNSKKKRVTPLIRWLDRDSDPGSQIDFKEYFPPPSPVNINQQRVGCNERLPLLLQRSCLPKSTFTTAAEEQSSQELESWMFTFQVKVLLIVRLLLLR